VLLAYGPMLGLEQILVQSICSLACVVAYIRQGLHSK
jgi:hypothetical protein